MQALAKSESGTRKSWRSAPAIATCATPASINTVGTSFRARSRRSRRHRSALLFGWRQFLGRPLELRQCRMVRDEFPDPLSFSAAIPATAPARKISRRRRRGNRPHPARCAGRKSQRHHLRRPGARNSGQGIFGGRSGRVQRRHSSRKHPCARHDQEQAAYRGDQRRWRGTGSTGLQRI